jgi:predicted exporter/lauroyl/myristoyl acyltransferase
MKLRHVIAAICVLAVLSVGLARLRFDVEVLNLLPARAKAVEGLKLFQEDFSNAGELILTVRAPDADAAASAAEKVANALRTRLGSAADIAWQPPWIERPAEAAELAAYTWFNQPPEIFGALTNRLLGANALHTALATRSRLATSLSPGDLARLGRDPFNLLEPPAAEAAGNMFNDPEALFAAPDGTFRLVFVQSHADLAGYQACQAWLDTVKACIQSLRLDGTIPSEIVIRYTGRPAFVAEIAGGMQRDINGSILGTVLVIAFLFYWTHRSWRPLLWLIAMLTMVLGGTLALGGLLLGTLNVVSAGFAAILLGLAGDYALILYQEHRAAPDEPVAEIRRRAGPGIVWSALTTAGAFLVLNAGRLPGLAQLGTLVAIGIGLAACGMLYGYLPPIVKKDHPPEAKVQPVLHAPSRFSNLRASAAWFATILFLIAAALLVWWRPPALDHSPDPLRPRRSPAYGALEEVRHEMAPGADPFWLIAAGRNEQETAERLDQVLPRLEEARRKGAISRFTLPAQLWPRPEYQTANRPVLERILEGEEEMREAARTAGFKPEALGATSSILETWRAALLVPKVFWPSNSVSRWVFDKFAARTEGRCLALGLVYPPEQPAATPKDSGPGTQDVTTEWIGLLPREGVWVASWALLGESVLEVVERDLFRVVVPMVILLAVVLWLTFRRLPECLLSLAALGLSGAGLLGVMSAAGWSWNLLNLMAMPLLLGAGIDYTLHIQLALRRHGGDVLAVRRIIGRALLLCAGTTVAGFGSLAWSSNAGLASLGKVCATGIGITFLVSIYLLPSWWQRFARPLHVSPTDELPSPSKRAAVAVQGPSSLYRSGPWRWGHWAVNHLPDWAISILSRTLPELYWYLNPRRCRTVIRNLLPALDNDEAKAAVAARELFHQFALKVADLWRYESGVSIENLVSEVKGWEHFIAARKPGRGILLLTPHLGNWELGAPLLTARGVHVSVVTLHEPDPRLTELRQAARSRWGIETIVIGQNPFVFVEVIQRLNAGGTVALLIDRPPATSATEVQLFGQPFAASIAAAELARASGCVLLPVLMPRMSKGYSAEVLPEIAYDRAALGSRRARAELTQQIIRLFEPAIRRYLSQWYHFVPIWPEGPSLAPPAAAGSNAESTAP